MKKVSSFWARVIQFALYFVMFGALMLPFRQFGWPDEPLDFLMAVDAVILCSVVLWASQHIYELISIKKDKWLTAEQWLKQLPDPYRRIALEEMTQGKYVTAENMNIALVCAFNWEKSKHGHKFWLEVYNHYHNGTPLPPVK